MRPIELGRAEAEYLVDLIEADDMPQFASVAVELRKQWGMVTRERELQHYECALAELERLRCRQPIVNVLLDVIKGDDRKSEP